ncbi:MAG: DUF805 domain-containing protein [Flavobacteriaceae bacterium]
MNWYIKVIKQYADFKGRARRREYWMFALFNIIVIMALLLVAGMIGSATDSVELVSIPIMIYYVAIILPSIAVAVRRLHDINKSGWYYLVSLIPLIGGIWLLVLLCTEGERGDNQYGSNPKDPSNELNEIGVSGS